MTRTTTFLAAAVTGLLLLGACSDQPTSPALSAGDQLLDADVAQVAADGAAQDVDIMRDVGFGTRFGLGFGPILGPPRTDGCTYANGRWTCPDISRGGLTFSRSFAFYDAAGQPMEQYDANQTASINVQTSVAGEVSHDNWSATIDRQRNMTVSGLQGDEQKRTWNGTGTSEESGSRHNDQGETRTYNMSAEVTVDNVEIPHGHNPSQDPWPLSGTITRHVSIQVLDANGNVVRQAERTVTITFDGTQFAKATVTGPNGTETFTIDLAMRRAHRGP